MRMGFFGSLFYPWGLLLQVVAIVHFIRRRPDTYWIFIILFLGPLGALIYLCVEALPDIGLARQSFKVFPAPQAHRRARIRHSRQSLRRETTKSSATSSWMTATFNRPAPHSTTPLPPAPIRSIPSTAAAFAPCS
jgi:hypothetical protein